MKRDIVAIGSNKVEVTLLMDHHEARRLARILQVAVEDGCLDTVEKRQWSRIYRAIRKQVTSTPLQYGRRRDRPPVSSVSADLDIDLVVNGSPPYPPLSVDDMKIAWEMLERKGLSSRQIAERLYVCQRTVIRWRKRKRKETEDGTT